MRTPDSALPTCLRRRARDAPSTASADAPATRLYKRARGRASKNMPVGAPATRQKRACGRACDGPPKTRLWTRLQRASKNATVDAPATRLQSTGAHLWRGFSVGHAGIQSCGVFACRAARLDQPARGYFMAGRLSTRPARLFCTPVLSCVRSLHASVHHVFAAAAPRTRLQTHLRRPPWSRLGDVRGVPGKGA